MKTLKHNNILIMLLFGALLFSCETDIVPPVGNTNMINIVSNSVSAIEVTSATMKGEIGSIGDKTIYEHGHCWSTSQNPTVLDFKTNLGAISNSGWFNSTLTGLMPDSKYYVRAYVSSDMETVYSDQISFVTDFYGRIVLIYSDYSYAYSFKQLLESRGFITDIIEKDNAISKNMDNYDLVIIGSNTSNGYEWGDFGTIEKIQNSGMPVLGLGLGGASLLGEIGLSINYGNSWLNNDQNSTQISSTSMRCCDPNHEIFEDPYTIDLSNEITKLYHNSGHVGEYYPSLNQAVHAIGREPNDDEHYSIVSEQQHLLWGFTNCPDYMTETGKDLFTNVIHYLVSEHEFFIFKENFDRSISYNWPSNWFVYNFNVAGNNWSLAYYYEDPSDIFAYVYWDGTNASCEYLISPVINLKSSVYNSMHLSFSTGYDNIWIYNVNPALYIYSYKSGSWDYVWDAESEESFTENWGWIDVNVDISSYLGDEIELLWNYEGIDGNFFTIDNICVTANIVDNGYKKNNFKQSYNSIKGIAAFKIK